MPPRVPEQFQTAPPFLAERGALLRVMSARLAPGNALRSETRRAFTLLEMLVVITIIGLLSTIGLVAIKGMTKSNATLAANRQLLDDFGYARQRAISDHTTVYVVFIPPNITTIAPTLGVDATRDNALTNLYTGQCTTYALLSLHTVGDQPGTSNPRYLTAWRTLPTGAYIATNKFTDMTGSGYAPMFYWTNFPFPFATNSSVQLPFMAFNYLGQLSDYNGNLLINTPQPREFIPLVHGNVFYTGSGNSITAEYLETPKGNAYYTNYPSQQAFNNQVFLGNEAGVVYDQIYIDPLTGKARVQHQDVQ